MPRHRRPAARATALLAAAAAALAAALLVPAAAAAAPAASYLRLAHLSPDTPTVDVYVTSVSDPAASFTVPGVGYGAVSPYRTVEAGTYTVSMRPAGASASSPPVISTTVQATAGTAHTVAGVGMSSTLGLAVLDDSLAVPPPGNASVRVINASVAVPQVDVGPPGGPAWAGGVKFGTTTDYRNVPLGATTLQVGAAGKPPVTLPVTLDANSVYSVILVDRSGTLDTQVHRDSTGAAVVPAGGVETGFGGAAGPSAGFAAGVAAAVAALVLAGGTFLVRRTTSRTR